MKKDSLEKAITYGRRLLNIRPRSEKELRERLFRKRFSPEDTKEALSFFKSKKLLDDLKFARVWVESRLRSSPRGAMLLERELREKGITQSIISQVVTSFVDEERSVAESLSEAKMHSLKNLPRQKARKKLFDYLVRKGFKFDVIDDMVNGYFHEDE